MGYNPIKSALDAIIELGEGTSRIFTQELSEKNHPAYLLPELQYGTKSKNTQL